MIRRITMKLSVSNIQSGIPKGSDDTATDLATWNTHVEANQIEKPINSQQKKGL